MLSTADNPQDLAKAAITAALTSNWFEAIKINEKILRLQKDDIEAVNRLARAYICLGEIKKAEKTYKRALEIDPFNVIARKNLDKITKSNGSSKTHLTNGHTNHLSNFNPIGVFLFEPGKTKVINLLNLAPPVILAALSCGEEVQINPKKHSVTINKEDGTYLGALPDDLAYRIITLIQSGNKYEAYVKCTTTKILTIIIHEVQRSPKFANQPSFQSNFNPFFQGEN